MAIREKRIAKGLTQDELATALNIRRTTVSMWETGNSMPRGEVLIKLAKILGCTIDELFGEENFDKAE